MKKYDYEAISNLSIEQKKQAVKKLAQVANKRLLNLEKSGMTQYAYASVKDRLHTKKGKPRFETNLSGKSAFDVNREFYMLEEFLNKKTSTVTGAKKAHNRVLQALKRDRVDEYGIFRRGLDLNTTNISDFFLFLQTKEYENLKKYVSSEDIQEFFVDIHGEIPYSTIIEMFQDFTTSRISGWNQMYDKVYELQELEFKYKHGEELTDSELEEYRRYFE